MGIELSIIVPAHNEEERLGPMLTVYAWYFTQRYGTGVEFIVVANACSDATAEVARRIGERYPQVRVIEEPARVGKGGALLIGFREARGRVVGFADADGSTPPDAFEDLVEHLDGADAVIASRWHADSVVEPRQPLLRRVASRIFNTVVRLLFGLATSDTQCGAKVVKREALDAVMPHLGLTRWAFDVDLLFQLKRGGYRIVELPTTWRDVAGSKLNVVRASLEMFLAVTRLRLLYSPLRWVVGIYDRTLGRVIHLERFMG